MRITELENNVSNKLPEAIYTINNAESEITKVEDNAIKTH